MIQLLEFNVYFDLFWNKRVPENWMTPTYFGSFSPSSPLTTSWCTKPHFFNCILFITALPPPPPFIFENFRPPPPPLPILASSRFFLHPPPPHLGGGGGGGGGGGVGVELWFMWQPIQPICERKSHFLAESSPPPPSPNRVKRLMWWNSQKVILIWYTFCCHLLCSSRASFNCIWDNTTQICQSFPLKWCMLWKYRGVKLNDSNGWLKFFVV